MCLVVVWNGLAPELRRAAGFPPQSPTPSPRPHLIHRVSSASLLLPDPGACWSEPVFTQRQDQR